MINQITWHKPDPPPNALHTAFTHAHETLLWAGKSKGARHTFNYDLINSRQPTSQMSSVWRIPSVPRREKLHGYHPTQKPLRLVRRALVACSGEGDLIFDPFCGSGTTGVAAKELGCLFVGVEMEEEYAKLAARRIAATERGSVLSEISGWTLARGPSIRRSTGNLVERLIVPQAARSYRHRYEKTAASCLNLAAILLWLRRTLLS